MKPEVSARVLLIEGNASNVRWVVDALRSAGNGCFELAHAVDLSAAESIIGAGHFDTVVVDVTCFGDKTGNLKQWQNQHLPDTPLILLANPAQEAQARGLCAAGAADYLLRGETNSQLLVRTLEFTIERRQLRGELAAARLDQERLATHDPLTGLPNRALFRDRLTASLLQAERNTEKLAVLFIDLDRFKSVNDTYGHDAGDHLLKQVSERLTAGVRGRDILARMGGDEFGCVLTGIGSPANAEKVARQILKSLSQPIALKEQLVACTPSIGIAIYPGDGVDASLLMKHADAAMYTAKQQGRACLRFFNAKIHAEEIRRLTLEADLRHAMERGEFSIHYQPILDPKTGTVKSLEALLRWEHPELGMIPPLDFILLAESSGMIISLGEWVLRTACAQNKVWQQQGLASFRVAVNLSALQFGDEHNLVGMVREALQETGLESRWLELEITEGATMNNPNATIEILTALRDLGVRIAIDDFGTGYSSLSYLQRFPIDTLKIDRSFVKDVMVDSESAAITNSIVHLAHSLGLETVAEGVEGADQEAYLRKLNCTYVQGYYYSKPLPVDEMTVMLRQGNLKWKAPVAAEVIDIHAPWKKQISAALKTSDGLPVMSEVGQKLLHLMQDPDAHVRELSDIVASDPALAAQIIRYANAPFFGFQGRIESVEKAVITVLGYDGVMGIALGLVAMGSLPASGKAMLAREGFWWKAVAAGSMAQALASQRPLRKRVKPGLAYLSALLRDIGHLFLVSQFAEACDAIADCQLQSPDTPHVDIENRVLGMNHAHIGEQLLRAWQLPEEVITAVARHHSVDYSGDFADYAYLLQVADILLDDEAGDELRAERLDGVVKHLGIDTDCVVDLWETILHDREGLESLARQLAA